MAQAFPRLLIVTAFPPRSRGGSIVLVRQMLKGWPADRIWWWSCGRSDKAGDAQLVARHFHPGTSNRLYPTRRHPRVRSWLMRRLWSPLATAHLRWTMAQCRPHVVWAIPQHWAILPMARVLLSGKVPFHVSLHDYADTEFMVQRAGLTVARNLAEQADAIYGSAESRDAICGPMVEDLRSRTGSAGGINRVGIEEEDIEFLEGKCSRPISEIRLAFAGTIIAEQAFEFFITALSAIRARLPLPVRMEFFGSHTHRGRSWFDPVWMRERLNVPEPDFQKALRECSWGVAPMAVADEDARYHRFSFPAKMTSYLAAGLPVIALAHPQGSLMEVFGRYDIGLCMTTASQEEFQSRLLAALSVGDPWLRHGEQIRHCAKLEFNAAKMRSTLHECFRAAASHS